MNLKDKIEDTITFYLAERDYYGVCWVEDAAAAIIAALPDYETQEARIKELKAALLELVLIIDDHCIPNAEMDGDLCLTGLLNNGMEAAFSALNANEVKK
tara:strand:+ start:483 stop:782 length:300 start_codon:yes stop_codon:yes gene_type:complete